MCLRMCVGKRIARSFSCFPLTAEENVICVNVTEPQTLRKRKNKTRQLNEEKKEEKYTFMYIYVECRDII